MKYFITILIHLVFLQLAFGQKLITFDSTKVMTGIEFQGGIGNFGDPTSHHGFSLSMNGALGNSNKSNTFGYDAFSVNAKWTPGTNEIGKRISIQFGTANWFTPALSTIYTDEVLTVEEKAAEAKSVNAFMAGLGFTIGSTRNPKGNAKDKEKLKEKQDQKGLELVAATNEFQKAKILKEIAALRWKHLIRKSFRKPTLYLGGMFRLGTLGTESDIEIYDLFATAAAGKGLFDFTAAFHYLKPIKDDLVAESAMTYSFGTFVDLQDTPPVNTMGFMVSYGKYNYLNKTLVSDANEMLEDEPSTQRLDFTLSFSNIIKGNNFTPFGTGIAFRLSKLWHSSTDDETQFVVIFTNKFVQSRQDKS